MIQKPGSRYFAVNGRFMHRRSQFCFAVYLQTFLASSHSYTLAFKTKLLKWNQTAPLHILSYYRRIDTKQMICKNRENSFVSLYLIELHGGFSCIELKCGLKYMQNAGASELSMRCANFSQFHFNSNPHALGQFQSHCFKQRFEAKLNRTPWISTNH